jgi:hypothetical protein
MALVSLLVHEANYIALCCVRGARRMLGHQAAATHCWVFP